MNSPSANASVEKPHAAMVILRDDQDRLAAVKNETRGKKLGFPGGKVEPGESTEEAAARELFEETGLIADELVSLGVFRSFDPYTKKDRLIALFCAPAWHGVLRSSSEGDAVWATEEEFVGPRSSFPDFNRKALRAQPDPFETSALPWGPAPLGAEAEPDEDRDVRTLVVDATNRIAKTYGKKPPPVIFTKKVTQAESAYDLDLLVNPLWIKAFLSKHGEPPEKQQAVLHWILGHEMTHFLFFDDDQDPGPFGNGLCSGPELRADFRAGQVMAVLGDSVEHIEEAVYDVTPGEPGRVRLKTVMDGFDFQKNEGEA